MSNTFKIPVAMFGAWLVGAAGATALTTNDLGAQHSLKILTQCAYLPDVPVLVRVEVRNADGAPERELWDAEAALSADGGVTLSTNRVRLRNGLGSALVRCAGGADFNLTATVGALSSGKALVTAASLPVTSVGGTLTEPSTVWRDVIRVTEDVTVPAGSTLTILSNTLVLIEGVSSGAVANDLLISGTIRSLGTEDMPVTITCATDGLRWGQIRHDSAQPSLYRHTSITRAGRAPGQGHTGTAPVIRPTNSRIVFENCNITDHAEGDRSEPDFGRPGKIAEASGSDLTFANCLLQRARMGPEIGGTALLCTNTWIMDMPGPDDGDGFYVHGQSASQQVLFTGCVIADGDDDGIDTLGSIIMVEDCIIRDWDNLLEDAKAISALNGEVHVRRSLIVNSTVGIAAKSGGSTPSTTTVLVTIDHSTISFNTTNLYANRKSSAVGPHVLITAKNSILWGGEAVRSDFEPASTNSTNFLITYCNLSEPQAGAGNLVTDPLFMDEALHNFRLRPHSPCIDSGHPSYPPDPDGSRTDMGWRPFSAPQPVLTSPEGAPGGGFQFTLNAYPNRDYLIESSAALPGWAVLQTNHQSAESMVVTDPRGAIEPQRFYRARAIYTPLEPPGPSNIAPLAFPLTNLVSGPNVLAVEVHQSTAGSSDIFMGVRLDALARTNAP